MTVIHTKYLDAEVNFPGDGEMEVERVLTKSGEDITNIINDLEAWGEVDRVVSAETERLNRVDAEEHNAGLYEARKLDKAVALYAESAKKEAGK